MPADDEGFDLAPNSSPLSRRTIVGAAAWSAPAIALAVASPAAATSTPDAGEIRLDPHASSLRNSGALTITGVILAAPGSMPDSVIVTYSNGYAAGPTTVPVNGNTFTIPIMAATAGTGTTIIGVSAPPLVPTYTTITVIPLSAPSDGYWVPSQADDGFGLGLGSVSRVRDWNGGNTVDTYVVHDARLTPGFDTRVLPLSGMILGKQYVDVDIKVRLGWLTLQAGFPFPHSGMVLGTTQQKTLSFTASPTDFYGPDTGLVPIEFGAGSENSTRFDVTYTFRPVGMATYTVKYRYN